MFVRTVAEAALMACMPVYALLRPVLLELKRRYPGGLSARLRELIGCTYSSQMPNLSCRIRVKAASMARKRLLEV